MSFTLNKLLGASHKSDNLKQWALFSHVVEERGLKCKCPSIPLRGRVPSMFNYSICAHHLGYSSAGRCLILISPLLSHGPCVSCLLCFLFSHWLESNLNQYDLIIPNYKLSSSNITFWNIRGHDFTVRFWIQFNLLCVSSFYLSSS